MINLSNISYSDILDFNIPCTDTEKLTKAKEVLKDFPEIEKKIKSMGKEQLSKISTYEWILMFLKEPTIFDKLSKSEQDFIDSKIKNVKVMKNNLTKEQLDAISYLVTMSYVKSQSINGCDTNHFTEDELNRINQSIKSSWNYMRNALKNGETEKALNFFSHYKKQQHRKKLYNLSNEKRIQLAESLKNIRFSNVEGSNHINYSLYIPNKGYWVPLKFEKNYNGNYGWDWKIIGIRGQIFESLE